MDTPNLVELNVDPVAARLRHLSHLAEAGYPAAGRDVNNHIHTFFSFSPYSPTAAAHYARMAGLQTAGIMDHDTLAGAREFAAAGRIAGLATTQGVELRASLAATPYAHTRVNNPDQDGCIYMAFHAVPDSALDPVQSALAPYRAARSARNRQMLERLNLLLAPHGIALDYDRDVLPLSQYAQGGSVTERHIAMALARALIAAHGTGDRLLDFWVNRMRLPVSPRIRGYLTDPANPILAYDLLGMIKSDLIADFYVPATDELIPVPDAIALAQRHGCIPVYPYLGDVRDSVTGDKRPQAFEDAYLDDLFAFLKNAGFQAVTYMPSRNTPDQIRRVQSLCQSFGFMQISGEDINSPRQSFICVAQRAQEFAHLYDSAWALIGHEIRADGHPERGLFGDDSLRELPDLDERIAVFAREARRARGVNA